METKEKIILENEDMASGIKVLADFKYWCEIINLKKEIINHQLHQQMQQMNCNKKENKN